MKKFRKILTSILTTLVLTLSLIVPSAIADGEGKKITVDILGFSVKYGDDELGSSVPFDEIVYDQTKDVKLSFNWSIDDTVNLEAGDYSLFDLPKAFEGIEGRSQGDVLGIFTDDNGENIDDVIGTWEITEDNKLKWVYNDQLQKHNEGREGDFFFSLKFDRSELENDAKQEITFGDADKKIDILVKPSGENVYDIKKFGIPNQQTNATEITWTVYVNTSLDSLVNGELVDPIPDGLKLDINSIKVTELQVGMDGKITELDLVSLDTDSSTDSSFNIKLGSNNKAYKVEFTTTIEEFKEAGYNNTATLKSNNDVKAKSTASVETSQGTVLDKQVMQPAKDAKEITWSIDVNKSLENLGNVSVEDTIPDGLTLDTITVYPLIYNQASNTWVQGATPITTSTTFPVALEDLDSAVRLVYTTTVDTSGDYWSHKSFTNKAQLKKDGVPYGKEVEKTVNVSRSAIFEKSGYEFDTGYKDPRIQWTLKVNEAKHTINGVVVKDVIQTGHKLDLDSLKIFKNGVDVTSEFSENTTKTERGFEINFGNIDEFYEVRYQTIITEVTQESYKNTGSMTGDGIGEDVIEFPSDVGHGVINSYTKTKHFGVGKEAALEIDYDNKLFGWQLNIDAKKESITDMVVTDTFDPEGSMVFLPKTLEVFSGTGKTPETLVEGTDYTWNYVDSENITKGFEIKFIIKLEKNLYRISYYTSYDPDTVIEAGGTINTNNDRVFKNKVKFSGTTEKGSQELEKDHKYTLKKEFFEGGNKNVSSVNVVDGIRVLDWTLNVNTLQQNLLGPAFTINDALSKSDTTITQVYDQDSLVVYRNTITLGGVIQPDTTNPLVKGDDYTVTFSEDNTSFELVFSDGIKDSYQVRYRTELVGLSQYTYNNVVKVTGKDNYEGNYTASTTYDNYNKFVDKKADDVDKAYTDDEIDWEITLNTSLSVIQNAVLRDVISTGHVYLNDSLVIKEGTNELKLGTDYTLTVNDLGELGTELLISFTNDVTKKLVMNYTTVVTATTGKISNHAELTGSDTNLGNDSSKELSAEIFSGGSATGSRPRGSIQISKINAETDALILQEAEFELSYMLNGVKQIVAGEHKTQNGILKFDNLPYRTYTLEEIKAPAGFVLDTEAKEFVVNGDPRHRHITYNFENTKQKRNVEATKTWVDGNTLERPVVYFKLFRSINEDAKLGDQGVEAVNTELKQIKTGTETGPITVIWNGLDVTDDAGNPYIYLVEEVDASGTAFTPTNYNKSEAGLNVTNTYESPKENISATKNWENGNLLQRPVVYFKLYRTTEPGVALDHESVVAVEEVLKKVETPKGTSSVTVTWEDLDVTDTDGNPFYYLVKEVDSEGNALTPNNYKVSHSGLTVTNTYVSPKTSVTVEKSWVDGKERFDKIEVQLFQDDVEYLDPVELNGDHDEVWSHTWDELDVTDEQGKPHVYTVKEVKGVDNFTPTYSEDTFKITNTYTSPTSDVEATKVWVNGDALDRPVVYFKLYRSIVEDAVLGDEGVEAVKVDLQKIETPEGENEVIVKWENLEDTDTDGNTYYYLVEEVDSEGNALAPENYVVLEEGLKVTNTYVSPKTTKTVNKSWINGKTRVQEIEVQLYQDEIPYGEPVTLDGEHDEVWSYTWEDLDVTDIDGVNYVYTVKEITTLENFDPDYSEDTFDITNTYIVPTSDVEATKVWVNGDALERPVIYFKLYRSIHEDAVLGDEGVEAVEVALQKIDTPEDTHEVTVKWENLEDTDTDGNTFYYLVEEVDAEGNAMIPENYDVSHSGLEITNTYVSPLTSKSVKKIWVEGPAEKDPIEVQLYRNGDPYLEPITLDGSEEDAWTYTWDGLDLNDKRGVAYVYSVEELTKVENFGVEYTEVDGVFVVTNTFESPVTSVIGRKSWVNGPSVKPDVTLQLLRNGEPHLEPVVLKSGEYEYIWLDLDALDNTGEPYVYTVEEVDIPENYVASYDGMNVTNTYVIPLTDITVEKIWIHEVKEAPTIGIQLYRNGEAYGDIVRLENGMNTYTWKDLDFTDEAGIEYIYTVDEVEVPLGYHKDVHGFTITNTFDEGLLGEIVPKPDDKLPVTGAVSLASIATGTLLASGLFFALSKKRKED